MLDEMLYVLLSIVEKEKNYEKGGNVRKRSGVCCGGRYLYVCASLYVH